MEMQIVKEFEYEQMIDMITSSSLETGIYVGCDSKRHGRKTDFVTVVVVHHDSCRGAKIFYQIGKLRRPIQLRERLWHEVVLAGECGLRISDAVGERPFSVHLDLNPDPIHRSSVISKEALAYIRALGLAPVIKPDSFAASHVADHVVRDPGAYN